MNSENRMDNANIAKDALAHYDLNVVSLSPIAQSGAAVFKIEDDCGLLYSLRVHKSISSTLEEIWTRRDVLDSELVWLDALNSVTSLTIPVPKRNQQGAYVTQVDKIYCTMLSWVAGEQNQYFTNDQELESTAEMTAILHNHASKWEPPSTFVRPTINSARIRLALDIFKQRVLEGVLDEHAVHILSVAGERAITLIDKLPKNKMTWGMLHGDIGPSNIVFINGVANPIDFGACGIGFFLTDLAITFFAIHPNTRQQYIDWYGKHFPLPNDYVEQLEGLFIALRLIVIMNCLGVPNAIDWLPADVEKSASREFSRYANRESFLFTGTPFWE
jgi:Ser/Thr protein kinase RdoA (MazF antagonist)